MNNEKPMNFKEWWNQQKLHPLWDQLLDATGNALLVRDLGDLVWAARDAEIRSLEEQVKKLEGELSLRNMGRS